MKTQVIAVILSGILLPLSQYLFGSNLISGAIGTAFITVITILWGFRMGMISAVWSGLVSVLQWYPEYNIIDILAQVCTYFVIVMGVGKTIDTIRNQNDRINKEKVKLDHLKDELELKDIALETSEVAIALIGRDEQMLYFNKSFARLWGYRSKEEMASVELSTLFVNKGNFRNTIGFIIEQGFWEGKFKARRKDGSIFHVYMQCNRFENQDGTVDNIMLTAFDFTEFERNREKLSQFAKMIEQAACMVVVLTPMGDVEYINTAFSELTGFKLNDTVGKSLKTFRFKSIFGNSGREVWREILKGNNYRGQFASKKKSGEKYWIDVSVIPFKDRNNNIINYVAYAFDCSDIMQKLNELEMYISEIVKKGNVKIEITDLFIKNIRKSLLYIDESVGKIDTNTLTYSDKDIVEKIARSANRTLEFSDKFKEFIDVKFLEISLIPTDFDVRNIIEDAVSSFSIAASQKNIELNCCIKPEVPYLLVGDSDKLRIVLCKLLDNAVKFTDNGEITVLVEKISEKDDVIEIKFFIGDTGVGIDQSLMKALSKDTMDYYESCSDEANSDMGFGLSIAKELVKRMGGQVNVNTCQDEGSVFYFEIPFIKARKGIFGVEQYFNSFDNAKLLVIQENCISSDMLRELLESWNARVTVAHNTNEIKNTIHDSSLKDDFTDVVLIDDFIRQVVGNDFFRTLRKDMEKIKDKIIVMLDPAVEMKMKAYYGSIGIDKYILKPVKQYELNRVIAEIVEKSENNSKTDEN